MTTEELLQEMLLHQIDFYSLVSDIGGWSVALLTVIFALLLVGSIFYFIRGL